jgi:hypothetical protein
MASAVPGLADPGLQDDDFATKLEVVCNRS